MGQTTQRVAGSVIALVALFAALVTPNGPWGPAVAEASTGAYLVTAGSAEAAAGAVHDVGGTVTTELELVGGVAATLDAPAATTLARLQDVTVVADQELAFQSVTTTAESEADLDLRDQLAWLHPGALWDLEEGAGVGVALIDTGVAPTADLDDRLIHGPDYTDEDDGLDRYGHGTFMAGLIAGDGTSPGSDGPTGIAPAAHVVSVKVAGADGRTSLSTLLEAIGWVVTNQDEYGIRVLNLSIGARMDAAPQADPLARAVEAAWASGITVVTASGNLGDGEVTSPGHSPWAITAGAVDTTTGITAGEVALADWSGAARVTSLYKPDLLAPGASVVSLRAPDSTIDVDHPEARVGDQYFRGSGTSMSTALVSGAVASLLDDRAWATPDDVKGALTSTGRPVADSQAVLVDLEAADASRPDDDWQQRHPVTVAPSRAVQLAQRDAPGPEVTWQRVRWMDDQWQRVRWMDDQWQRVRWMDANFTRVRWMDANFTRVRWMDGDWARVRWMSERWTGTDTWTASDWDAAIWTDQPTS
jgi:serine protease AprX